MMNRTVKTVLSVAISVVGICALPAVLYLRTHSIWLTVAYILFTLLMILCARAAPKFSTRHANNLAILPMPFFFAALDGSASIVQFAAFSAFAISFWALTLVMYEPERPGIVL